LQDLESVGAAPNCTGAALCFSRLWIRRSQYSGFVVRSHQNCKGAEAGFARETRRSNLRGVPSPKSERVRRTWISSSHQSSLATGRFSCRPPHTQMSLQRTEGQSPASAELRPFQSARFKFIDQSSDFVPAAPSPTTTRFVFSLHEPSSPKTRASRQMGLVERLQVSVRPTSEACSFSLSSTSLVTCLQRPDFQRSQLPGRSTAFSWIRICDRSTCSELPCQR
jgi:hypothetical protein